MNISPEDKPPTESIAQQAAAWVLRCDRGLAPAEQDAFSEWLAADPRHGAQIARHRRHWKRLDQLAEWRPEHSARPNPDLLAPPLRRRLVRYAPIAVAFAAAASLAVLFAPLTTKPARHEAVRAAAVADVSPAPNQRVLEDGTIVELNRGAELTTEFTATERRVRLQRGEAHFAVAKDPARPFVVRARGVDVRAVGTAFNVRVDAATVEVLVTEGRVQLETEREVAAPAVAGEAPAPPPILEARQRAVVSLAPDPPAPQIATLTAGEIERVLAWQHRLLDFTATPLKDVVAELNRRNVVQLVLVDPELAAMPFSAAMRSDNIEGFVRLLEAGFGTRVERRGDTEILLRAAK